MSKSQIMRQAWSLYRQTVTEYPETRSRAQFAVCLKEAHRAAKAAKAARCEWDAMTGEEKYSALIRMTWTMKHRAEAQGRDMDTDWIVTPDDAQTVAADAYCRMIAALDRNEQREEPRPLAYLIFSACAQAAHSISRAERRHANACRQIVADDGQAQTVIDLSASVTAEPITQGPEAAAITAEIIREAIATDTDKIIVQQLAAGYTVRDIAAVLAMSKSSVQRRIEAIRERYRKAIA